jgi:acyl transferase domain-containing protein
LRVNGHKSETDAAEVWSYTNGSIRDEEFSQETFTAEDNRVASTVTKLDTNGIESSSVSLQSSTKLQPQLLVFTAHTQASLSRMIQNVAQWASSSVKDKQDFSSLTYTLSSRRSLLTWRSSVIADSYSSFVLSTKNAIPTVFKASNHVKVVLVFTGQGSQWAGMGRELHSNSVFRSSLVKSDNILKTLGAEWSLLEKLQKDINSTQINESRIAQPGIVALQIALVDLLYALGVKPDIVLGHSSGEIGAAYAAGILSHMDAIKVAFNRCFLSPKIKGAMLAVGLGENQVTHHLDTINATKLSIACVNSDSSVTISGDETEISKLQEHLDQSSIFNRKLPVDRAYHSKSMFEVANAYQQALHDVVWKQPSSGIKFISTVTGLEKESDFGPLYWAQNLVSTVRFYDALKTLCTLHSANSSWESKEAMHAVVEIGPHSALSGPIRQSISSFAADAFPFFYSPSMLRNQNCIQTILKLSGDLFNHGYVVNIDAANSLTNTSHTKKVVHNLPPYPWNHSTSYWHESRISEEYRLRPHSFHQLLGTRVIGASEPTWRNVISVETIPWLQYHVIEKLMIFPAAAYISLAIEGLYQLSIEQGTSASIRRFVLKNLTFTEALVISEPPSKTEIQLRFQQSNAFTGSESKYYHFQVVSQLEQSWHKHCHGLICFEQGQDADSSDSQSETLIEDNQREHEYATRDWSVIDSEYLYNQFLEHGNDYRSIFRMIAELRIDGSHAFGSLRIPADFSGKNYLIHPALLDSVFHTNLPLSYQRPTVGPTVPISINEITISKNVPNITGSSLAISAEVVSQNSHSSHIDTKVFEPSASLSTLPLITVKGCSLHRIGRPQKLDSDDIWKSVYRPLWKTDVNFISEKEIESAERVGPIQSVISPTRRLEILNKAASYYIKQCIDAIETENTKVAHEHHGHLFRWMKNYLENDVVDSSSEHTNTFAVQDLECNIDNVGPQGELLLRTGKNLFQFLIGELDPLASMLEEDLLYRAYAEDSLLQCGTYLTDYTKKLLFKQPSLAVLEIGAGTGGTTAPLFQSLNDEELRSLRRYDFTDISAGFFGPASTLLKGYIERIEFKKLDIEQDPLEQGFDLESYDLIIASNVLHATTNLDIVLKNARRLLKPDGRLAMIEVTKLQPYLQIIFGLLPGWWKGRLSSSAYLQWLNSCRC